MAIQIQLLDNSGSIVATASVAARGDVYSGTINLGPMPPRIREIFSRYENIVNDQVLGLLDQIEDEISGIHLIARFGADEFKVKDMQIFPEAGTLWFKTIREPIRVG